MTPAEWESKCWEDGDMWPAPGEIAHVIEQAVAEVLQKPAERPAWIDEAAAELGTFADGSTKTAKLIAVVIERHWRSHGH